MPTHDESSRFLREHKALTDAEAAAFGRAWRRLHADLDAGRPPHNSLRVRQLVTAPGIFELTWSEPNGRATFEYGTPRRAGHMHIKWRRIGGHEIFNNP